MVAGQLLPETPDYITINAVFDNCAKKTSIFVNLEIDLWMGLEVF